MTGTVERLNVEPVTPMRSNKPVFEASPKLNPVADFIDSILPVFSALAAVLAVKLFLLFAIIGAFILAQAALSDTTYHGIWVLISYCAFTILPLVFLDIRGKKSV